MDTRSPTVVMVDAATGTESVRPMTADEEEALRTAQAELAALEQAAAAAAAAEQAARERALGKLRALGLTDADLTALGIR